MVRLAVDRPRPSSIRPAAPGTNEPRRPNPRPDSPPKPPERARTGHTAKRGRKGVAQPFVEILPIIAPHHLVADAVCEFVDPCFQCGAAFRRAETSAFDLARPDHFAEWLGRADHLLDRGASAGARKVVGILPFGQQGETQTFGGLEMRQRQIGGAKRRTLASAIAVEAKDRLVGHLPKQRKLVLGQCCSERRDGGGVTRADQWR